MLEKLPLGPGSIDNNERLAIDAWDGSLSYGELALAVSRRADLLEQTAGPIAVLANASADYVISFLAGIKLQRPIMPLSPDAPEARLSQVFRHAKPGVVVLSADAASRRNEGCLADYSCLLTGSADDQLILSRADEPAFDYPELCAYIITTSGSTGEPKLIAGSRAGLDHFIDWEVTQLPQELRVSFLSAPVFDVSLRDMLLPLCSQGTLCIPKPEILLDASKLTEWIARSQVNLVHIVPTLLRTLYPQLADGKSQAPEFLQYVASAGEPLLKADVVRLRNLIRPDLKVLNLYGPSETSLAKCCYLCPQDVPDSSPLPIGKPLPDTSVILFDDNRCPIDKTGTGQIGIATKFPSLGYIRDGAIVSPDWLFASDGREFFPTGDLGSFAANGDLLIHGRLDRQLKIRGQRVEPGEIEARLRDLESVKNGAVVASNALPGGTALLAYVVLAKENPNAEALIRDQLAEQLPEYMVPARVIIIDALPLTRSGKVDVKALPEPGRDRPNLGNAYKTPRGSLQIKMAGFWSEQLHIDSPGARDTFFDLGGTSLQAQHITAQLSEYLQRDLAVTDFFAYPIIEAFSAWIEGASKNERSSGKRARASASDKAIAIVGLAGSFPGASNVDELWDALLQSDDQISMFSAEELDPMLDPAITQQDNYVPARGQMPDIDAFDAALFGITPREAQIIDPQQRVFLQTAWHALEDAAFDPGRFDGKIGVYAGTGDNTYLWKVILRNPNAIDELGEHPLHLANERDYLATRVAYKLGLTGPAINVATACSTSLVAIGQAADSIRAGHCDAAIAGGVFVPCPHSAGHLYQPGGFGSSDGHCRPFDADASGTVFSSGSAAVVLRRLDDALANGDRIYGLVRGFGLNNDGSDKMSFMAPSAAGQADAIRSALSDAGLNGSDIGWVEGHGTATPIGDPIEVAALNEALGEAPVRSRILGSVKGHLGHLDAAAGATAVIKMAKAMQTGVLPGTAHFKRANSQVELDKGGFTVSSKPVNWQSEHDKMIAGISSFGVGGTNAHLIVESMEPPPQSTSREQEVFLLSAASEDALSRQHDNLAAYFSQKSSAGISDAAFTLARGRKKLALRATVRAGPGSTPAQAFENAKSELEVLTAAASDQVAFVFPGQGSQHVAMAVGLYKNSAVYKDVIDHGAEYLQSNLGIDLRELLFADPGDSKRQTELAATQFAQPALYLMQCALAAHWKSWGVVPSLVMGHSVGEFSAAHVAGVMSFEAGLELVKERGRLCALQEPGAMLSVRAAADTVRPYLSERLELAAINAPKLVVVSGARDDIDKLQEDLLSQEIACSVLQTSHAFHSYMMEPARAEFERCVATQSLEKPEIAYVSTLTGDRVDEDAVTTPEYWGRQLRHS
ncbi:MAG: beta-ketoacyl synthase N-terminal-like domain-containing protein, partial [Pseudomonadota bacterium]